MCEWKTLNSYITSNLSKQNKRNDHIYNKDGCEQ